MLRRVNGCDPRQYGLDFGLWTHAVVADPIERKFGVRLRVTSVVALLERHGLSAQKPQQRAYQRDSQAIERWQREHYPRIALPARRGATAPRSCFGDLIRSFFMAPSVAYVYKC